MNQSITNNSASFNNLPKSPSGQDELEECSTVTSEFPILYKSKQQQLDLSYNAPTSKPYSGTEPIFKKA